MKSKFRLWAAKGGRIYDVITGLEPPIQEKNRILSCWMAGSSPAMTTRGLAMPRKRAQIAGV